MEYWQPSPYKICSAWILFITLDIVYVVSVVESSSTSDEVYRHLTLGGEMLARGQLQDALIHYHAAVDGDPSNYLTFFKRGTVYLALGKASQALADFNKVLDLKNDFSGAKYQRAQIFLKMGRLDEAEEDFLQLYHYDGNIEAHDQLIIINDIKHKIVDSESYMKATNYRAAIDLLSYIIEICPWSVKMREMRSECYVAEGEPHNAVMDLRSSTKRLPDNTDGYLKLSLLYYSLGEPEESLREIRECLKLDPEHKECFPHYKKVKKVAQHWTGSQEALDRADHDDCVLQASKILKLEKQVRLILHGAQARLCKCFMKLDKNTEALEACGAAIQIEATPDLFCDRAEAYINNDMYDEAMRDYHAALDLNKGFERAREGLQRAQRLQKGSERRDYYKILNVGKRASKQEITKAYRKAAQKWHPDNFPDGDEKKRAEKKFIDIAAAKEVLTDPEKRRKFDQGEDPLDPESGQHHGFNPFQEFHQYHSGGPFTFKFHFN